MHHQNRTDFISQPSSVECAAAMHLCDTEREESGRRREEVDDAASERLLYALTTMMKDAE
jgi:hypothetical protein